MEPIRVVLADDHTVVGAGLRNALEGLPNIEIVDEIGNGQALTVLVVDDNPRYRQQLCRLIGKIYPASVIFDR